MQFHYHDETCIECLVEALGRRHGSLDGQATDVLPSLLQQRDEVIDGKHDVSNQLVLGHADIANSDSHAKNLLELELDGGLDISDLVLEVVGVGDGRWEFAGLGKTWTQKTRNLLDQSLRSEESVILASKLLDELLVLVELLQILSGHGIDSEMLSTIDIVLVTKDANGQVWAGYVRELDSSGETLVTLGIVVLEADLKLDCLEEIALLGFGGVLEELLDIGTDAGD